uniref:Sidoreflexin n=1 Tax=Clastoptera arizonana TaxID=38151 RepID=A0A1B6CGB4_9HEMI
MNRIDFDAPPWDQKTFIGRLKYFFWVTDPRLAIADETSLDKAKKLRDLYLAGKEPAGTTLNEVMRAKQLYESAFHPDSGEKMNVFGRMSFQVPGGMLVTGAMLTFYKTTGALVFWQWVNQSFNALVNYTNRNAKSPLTEKQMAVAYISASSAACFTAMGLKTFLSKRTGPMMQRYVPFAAVAAANCVNIPLMRQTELIDGIDVCDENGNNVGQSRLAAVKGISQVVLCRIIMCAPGMNVLPIIMKKLEENQKFRAATWFHAPFQTIMVGGFLLFMVPFACALFPQQCALNTSWIAQFEPQKYSEMEKKSGGRENIPQYIYFNKGL